MGALLLDIIIEQGASWQREFAVQHQVSGVWVGFPLTGFTFSGDVTDAKGATLASFALTGTGNKVLAELTDEQTALLHPAPKFTNNSYFVKAVSPGGIGYRIARGQAIISSEK